MKEIKLNLGLVTQVDNNWFEYLNQWKWFVSVSSTNRYYARRNECHNYKQTSIYMHRLIMNTPSNLTVDHIDHNSLNNQKNNLRNCSHQDNCRNSSSHLLNKYKGVCVSVRTGGIYISAKIKANGKLMHLGYFKTEEEAALAYDVAVKKYYGEFANLNFK